MRGRPTDRLWDPWVPTTRQTIVVSESSDEAKEERERKIDAGAEVVPFGFGRVLHEPAPEPETWEGQGL